MVRAPEVIKNWKEERNARVFRAIRGGRQWALDIARATGLAPLGMTATLRFLAKQGFLERDNGKYKLTEKGQLFLAERENPNVVAGKKRKLPK